MMLFLGNLKIAREGQHNKKTQQDNKTTTRQPQGSAKKNTQHNATQEKARQVKTRQG